MAAKKYYDIARRERTKFQKKLLKTLKKNGYDDEDVIVIVDSLSGRTALGKENASQELLALLDEGADRDAVLKRASAYRENKYPYTVK